MYKNYKAKHICLRYCIDLFIFGLNILPKNKFIGKKVNIHIQRVGAPQKTFANVVTLSKSTNLIGRFV